MGLWSEQVTPRLTDKLNSAGIRELRAATCAGLTGDVLEIGFGSGLNLPHYPDAVTRVTAVEPSAVAKRLAGGRVAAARPQVRFAGDDAARLPFDDESFDAALSTMTLCTIPDIERALQEVLRVLRPGGSFFFVEHGRAPDPKTLRWQRGLEPVQKRLFGGCHLTRDVPELLRRSGFEMTDVDSRFMPGPALFRPLSYLTRGHVRRA